MTKQNAPARTAEAGYTLIELLVVLAILGLLATIATTQVIGYLERAKISTAHAEVESFSSALELFKLDVGRYPTSQEGLGGLTTALPGATNWHGPYVKNTTTLNDPWGHPFHYVAPGQHGEFDLYSDGPDGGSKSGEPAIRNWK